MYLDVFFQPISFDYKHIFVWKTHMDCLTLTAEVKENARFGYMWMVTNGTIWKSLLPMQFEIVNSYPFVCGIV